MTYATEFKTLFEDIERDEDGRRDSEQLLAFRKALDASTINAIEECPESYDSAFVHTLADGSVLRIANPNQSAFCAYVEVLND